jgi:hypothetical protein
MPPRAAPEPNVPCRLADFDKVAVALESWPCAAIAAIAPTPSHVRFSRVGSRPKSETVTLNSCEKLGTSETGADAAAAAGTMVICPCASGGERAICALAGALKLKTATTAKQTEVRVECGLVVAHLAV